MKLFFKLLTLAFVISLLCVSAFAAKTVYVKSTDVVGVSGDGSYQNPYPDIFRAVESLDGEGGTIVLLGDVTVGTVTLAEQSGDLTITSENGGKLVLAGTLTFEKNKNSNVITLDCPVSTSAARPLFGGFNNIVFTENFVVDGELSFYGGLDSAKNETSGVGDRAVNDAANRRIITELPYSITVNGGTFAKFFGGNRRSAADTIVGSIAAPVSITINGGTFGTEVSYAANDPIKTECAFSISGYSILADDATLTINGGTFNAPLYAQGHLGEMCTAASGGSQITKSDRKYYVCDGDITIDINGGRFFGCEINAFQNSSVYTLLLRGNYNLDISENALFNNGTVLDATQVKAYDGSQNKATLAYSNSASFVVKRFDVVNGESVSYEEPLRIACIGDSITEGYSSGSRQTLSYPAQLLQKLHGEGKDVILGNYGCSGTRVEDYNSQYYNDMLAYVLALESDSDYVIIGLGTNDAGVIQGGRGQLVRFYEEYTALLCDFGELPTTEKVFATTATHRPSTLGYGAINVRSYQIKATEELAKSSDKYVLVDLYALTLQDALDGKFLSSDNLHPHADGYAIYVDVLYNAIYNGVCRVDGFESRDIYLSASGTANMEATAENPTNSLMIAFAKAAPESTLHIVGEYTAEVYDQNRVISTPPVEKFTIKGEGEGAKLVSNSKFFLATSDIVLDNFTLTTSSANSILIALGYNNATLTETFATEAAHYPLLAAGYITYAPTKSSTYYSTHESVSSNNNCVINVNGGVYAYLIGGNYLYNTSSILGTYSGDLTMNIGSGVEFVSISNNAGGRYSGACGQNYLTGNIVFNVSAWHEGIGIREYANPSTNGEGKTYNPINNTGSVTINRNGIDNPLVLMGDFNGDEKVTVFDALVMIKAFVNGSFDMGANYYGRTAITLNDVVRLIKNI